jgi:sirohydrochlorin ferrochelatase
MKSLDPHTAVIVVDHGSRRREANDMLDKVACLYQHTTGVAIVEPAHMELAEPTIAQAFARCVARGARRVIVHPYFLSPGRHSTSDIPTLAAEAAAAHPGVDYLVTDALGLDPRMAEVMHRRVTEALAAVSPVV